VYVCVVLMMRYIDGDGGVRSDEKWWRECQSQIRVESGKEWRGVQWSVLIPALIDCKIDKIDMMKGMIQNKAM
jgi:hypothetical protein